LLAYSGAKAATVAALITEALRAGSAAGSAASATPTGAARPGCA